jgi:hypothetical protein
MTNVIKCERCKKPIEEWELDNHGRRVCGSCFINGGE